MASSSCGDAAAAEAAASGSCGHSGAPLQSANRAGVYRLDPTFRLYHKRHPKDMGGAEVEAFLLSLATVGRVSASTQNQALSALLFLCIEVLGLRVPALQRIVRARKPQRLPAVLTRDEVRRVLGELRQVPTPARIVNIPCESR